jgi:hypothetical protein
MVLVVPLCVSNTLAIVPRIDSSKKLKTEQEYTCSEHLSRTFLFVPVDVPAVPVDQKQKKSFEINDLRRSLSGCTFVPVK